MSEQRRQLPDAVQRCADDFTEEVRRALGDDLIALWFYGAMAFEGSEDVITDIDFHAIVETPFDDVRRARIETVHRGIAQRHGWLGEELDGYYVTIEDAKQSARPRTQRAPGPEDDMWAVHRAHWVAGRVIVAYGPHPKGIVREPAWEEIERDLRDELEGSCTRWAGTEGSAYSVLNACRVLYSLQHRDPVIAKKDAGAWALGDEMPEPWHPLIRAAQRRYRDQHSDDDMRLLKQMSPVFVDAMKKHLR